MGPDVQSDPESARPWLAQAAGTARETGQLDLLSQSLSLASIAENMAGDRASARRLLDEAQTVTSSLDDASARLGVLQAQALNGLFGGDLERSNLPLQKARASPENQVTSTVSR